MSDYKVSKSLGSVLKWSGRYTFFFLVAALIMTVITVSLADPNANEYITSGDKQTLAEFSISSNRDMLFFIGVDGDQRNTTFAIYKVEYIDAANNSNDFRQSPQDTVVNIEILSILTVNTYERQLELPKGDYKIEIESASGNSIWMVYAYINLGTILGTAVLYVIFSILVTLFFTVLPFWFFTLVIETIGKSASRSSPAPHGPPLRQKDPPAARTESLSSVPLTAEHSSTSNRPKFAKGTQFEKLTRRDWIWISIGGLFTLGYLSDPLDNGFALFMALVIFGLVFYNYTEREKTKDRLTMLLTAYPKVTIAFVAEQLDKKEDHVVEVLRIMILDEGAPIRLDLINRTITKVGDLTDFRSSVPVTQAPVQEFRGEPVVTHEEDTTSSEEPAVEVAEEAAPDDDTEVVHGDQGEIRQPWAYCQACGEALKKKVKYCYGCGARQYD